MSQRWYLLILGTIEAALILLLFIKPISAGVVTAVVIVAAMMILVPNLPRITEFDVFGLRTRMQNVEHGVAMTNEEVRRANEAIDLTNLRLDALFALSIADWQFHNLRKLASGTFGPYVRSIGLENDLRHLRNHGYVEIASVRDIPDEGEELCDHVRVTETGHAFVTFRESLQISARELIVQEGRLRPASVSARERETQPESSVDHAGD